MVLSPELALLTPRTPVSRPSSVNRSLDLRAALHARLARSLVNLPEPFERRAVRESFLEIEAAVEVLDGVHQNFCDCFVEPRHALRGKLSSRFEWVDAGAK